jgi:hypothetical protein
MDGRIFWRETARNQTLGRKACIHILLIGRVVVQRKPFQRRCNLKGLGSQMNQSGRLPCTDSTGAGVQFGTIGNRT